MNNVKDNPMVKEVKEDGSRIIRNENEPATMRDVLHYYFGCVDMIVKRDTKMNASLIVSVLDLLLIIAYMILNCN